jgi:two-component system NtrC family sensor kinase
MKIASLPPNEKERLLALLNYEILDTLIEQSYDGITQLASVICETPIALISLIDKDRQWFKSHHGLEVTETPRDLAFCAHAILESTPFIVEDLHLDDRFSDNPFVTGGPLVRFYAGIPLQTPEGYNIGTICVIDHSPKKLNETQINSLKILSQQVINLMELKKTLKLKDLQQAQLVNSSKMASLGEIAAGVAHEINNSLMILVGKSNLVKRLIVSDPIDILKIKEHLDRVDVVTEKICLVVKSMGIFSRDPSNASMVTTKVDEIIKNTLSLCKERFENQLIEIKIDIKDDVTVECHPSEISQVIMNLLFNAYDAIENLPEKWIEIKADRRDDYIEIRVTDSGKGIAKNIIEKLMQPFFTTKEIGKGTGLGLSISYGIIQKHHGSFKYDSNSANTSFVITLPTQQPKL